MGINYSGSERGRAATDALLAGITSAGGRALLLPADVTDPLQVAGTFGLTEQKSGLPDLPAHSAETISRHKLEVLDIDEWRRTVKADLTGAFIVVRHAAATIHRHDAGGLVSIGLHTAITGGGGGGARSASSKAGLERLTRHLTRELVPDHIRVNTIVPSPINTEKAMRTRRSGRPLPRRPRGGVWALRSIPPMRWSSCCPSGLASLRPQRARRRKYSQGSARPVGTSVSAAALVHRTGYANHRPCEHCANRRHRHGRPLRRHRLRPCGRVLRARLRVRR